MTLTAPDIKKPPVCLTIAGLDPSGGAGIIADIKTFSAFKCFAAAAVTSITFQNTTGVFGAVHQAADTVRRQAEAVSSDYELAAIKTGMLPTRTVIEAVVAFLIDTGAKNVVIDPVVRSTSGYDLIDDDALAALVLGLFPLAAVVTPNIPEAERITATSIQSPDDVVTAARMIQSKGAANVLIKGGHANWAGAHNKASDYLFIGDEMTVLESDFVKTSATHGTGCTLSAAIAANMALGNDLRGAVQRAKDFVTEAIRSAPGLGHGHSPINI